MTAALPDVPSKDTHKRNPDSLESLSYVFDVLVASNARRDDTNDTQLMRRMRGVLHKSKNRGSHTL